MTDRKGFVYLAGAGPGDPGLLTMKADQALRRADVILFDDLVAQELVRQYPAEKIYTGKRKGSHHASQEEINRELVRHALAGKVVVRLKGGDPFVFGRGGEEIAVLRRYGIAYEIIPGVTAAHGASAYTEIPLTMRGVSSSVAFCTGHPVSRITVPAADTLVFYMVASSLHEVLDAVVASGRSAETGAAIVQNATRYNQKTVFGTINSFRSRQSPIPSPALLIIGDNIGQFIENSWYSRKRKVLVTGAGDPGRYAEDAFVRVRWSCAAAGCGPACSSCSAVDPGPPSAPAPPVDLAYIDEIYFASPACVGNFLHSFGMVPGRILCTPADDSTAAALRRVFGR